MVVRPSIVMTRVAGVTGKTNYRIVIILSS
jgi:hypothetical protein